MENDGLTTVPTPIIATPPPPPPTYAAGSYARGGYL